MSTAARTGIVPAHRGRNLPEWVWRVSGGVVLLSLWELAARVGWINEVLFPPPSTLVQTIESLLIDGFPLGITMMVHIRATFVRIILGFSIAASVAIPLGLWLGKWRFVERATEPLVTFARSVAAISLLPVAVIWFGVGEVARVFLILYAGFWIILTSTISAVRGVNEVYKLAAKTLGASDRRVFWKVTLMAALPRIFAGLKVALGISFIVIVAVEMIGTERGLGALIQQARFFYRGDVAISGMVFLGFIGLALSWVLRYLEDRLLPWRTSLTEVRK